MCTESISYWLRDAITTYSTVCWIRKRAKNISQITIISKILRQIFYQQATWVQLIIVCLISTDEITLYGGFVNTFPVQFISSRCGLLSIHTVFHKPISFALTYNIDIDIFMDSMFKVCRNLSEVKIFQCKYLHIKFLLNLSTNFSKEYSWNLVAKESLV